MCNIINNNNNNNNNNNTINLHSACQGTQRHLTKWNKQNKEWMERLSVSTEGTLALMSVAPSVYKLASGGSVHTAGATQETKRSNPSHDVTAEVQVPLCWTPEDPASDGEVATSQHRCEPGETTAAEEETKQPGGE